ncbi:alpha-galactosidase [Leuconostoc mesenteroides]|uniref:alpha-galactosidase n=1 Tax=Leuconostoc mesenteroides TaxID=1245 RepID=UPI00112AD996|nr:alpha-galactosidase [Leuconostoc mesenteroides]MCT3053897.1 alpha-galactosidase [Leuconostoc mesenteroides]TPF02935.1 alpha-galactosidase [Leuconostoc mesenteroides]
MANANISFDDKQNVFHLSNRQISYLIQIEEGGLLSHLYFGKKITKYHGSRHYPRLDRGFSPNLAGKPHQTDRSYSKDTLLQEYGSYNTGDFRQAAIKIQGANGAQASDFRFQSFKIINGKPHLDCLPQAYVLSEDEAKTLIINLVDSTLNVQVSLYYTIYNDRPVVARSTKITNLSQQSINIEKIASMQLDLPASDLEIISLPGAHVRERQMERQIVRQGVTEFSSHRGTSSHHMNPFVALVTPNTTENEGEAVGIQLVYSGNHQFTIERDYVEQTRVLSGINEDGFDWQLNADDDFQTPEALLVYSDEGLNGMSQAYHHLLRERVARGKYQYAERPIVINNWEATYFDFNAEKIQEILDEASPLGIEMFVLDDGWFGKRDDDDSSLGDWFEYATKLQSGGGLVGLSDKVHEKGMKFGLWFEPEMISKNSDLYRQHPDYILGMPNRDLTPSRDQYVLDFSRPEVVDNIFQQVVNILDNVKIDYIKWDMNRHLTEVYSAALSPERQGEVGHRYMLGVYDLADRLTKRYPDILFEGCSGGGGRFDAGMLYFFPQSWTSDNTDPVERLKIQYGTTLSYPVSSMTAHVSASPNHQTGRQTSLAMRGDVATAGVFGYELNLAELSLEEKSEIKDQVTFYKQHRSLIQYGNFYRIKSPFKNNETAWEFISEDKTEALLFNYRVLSTAQPVFTVTKMSHLKSDGIYVDQRTNEHYSGDELMSIGLYNTPIKQADFTSAVRYFKWQAE